MDADDDENNDIQTQMHHVWNARQTLPQSNLNLDFVQEFSSGFSLFCEGVSFQQVQIHNFSSKVLQNFTENKMTENKFNEFPEKFN